MQRVRASGVSDTGSLIGKPQPDIDFTIPNSISPRHADDRVIVTTHRGRRRKNLELLFEVSVSAALFLSCFAYAVYALLSMSR